MLGQRQIFMYKNFSNKNHLTFLLDVDDVWPPVGAETFPVRPVDSGFEVLHPPLFIRNMSVGDVIDVSLTETGEVAAWSHRTRSDRTTIWLLRLQPTQEISHTLAKLRALGCFTVGGDPELGCWSIDVPPAVELDKVDEVLAGLDTKSVAVAFPSLRHIEPG